MNLKRTAFALLVTVLIIIVGTVPKASADWYDDIQSGYSVKIVGQNFVADTFCGVNAYYNETDNSVYHCGELVERFYKEAYGLDVSISSSEPRLIMNTAGYKFINPKTAKAGDVVFVSAEMRGTHDHWAIVKYRTDGYLVLFEQNVVYNGTAGVERKLKYPSDSYIVFSPVSEGEKPAPALKNSGTSSQTSAVAETTDKETTTAATTLKPTTKPTTTTNPTTTVKPTTTKLATTAKPTTTKPTTTAKPTTTKPTTTKPTTQKQTTVAVSETTTAAASTVPDTTVIQPVTYTFAAFTQTEPASSTAHFYVEETTQANIEKSNSATIPLASACGVSASGVAVLAALIIKKK